MVTTPTTRAKTIEVLDDAIAFTKAADGCAMKESTARALAAALGALPSDQILRICASAREQQLRNEARIREHNAARKTRMGR